MHTVISVFPNVQSICGRRKRPQPLHHVPVAAVRQRERLGQVSESIVAHLVRHRDSDYDSRVKLVSSFRGKLRQLICIYHDSNVTIAVLSKRSGDLIRGKKVSSPSAVAFPHVRNVGRTLDKGAGAVHPTY